jgi:hypothetical protein
LGVLVDAVEFDGDLPIAVLRREREPLAIPGDAARSIARTAGVLWAERALNAPVVRKLNGAPRRVIEAGVKASWFVAELKSPAEVEIDIMARSRGYGSLLNVGGIDGGGEGIAWQCYGEGGYAPESPGEHR